MSKPVEPFEVYENKDGSARFVFSHSNEDFTTGVLLLQPNTSLPKHNRPGGYENLTQLSGVSKMTVYSDENTIDKEISLESGDILRMNKGQWHIHGNETDEMSITFFKLVGDITEIMKTLRLQSQKVVLKDK